MALLGQLEKTRRSSFLWVLRDYHSVEEAGKSTVWVLRDYRSVEEPGKSTVWVLRDYRSVEEPGKSTVGEISWKQVQDHGTRNVVGFWMDPSALSHLLSSGDPISMFPVHLSILPSPAGKPHRQTCQARKDSLAASSCTACKQRWPAHHPSNFLPRPQAGVKSSV